MIIIDSRSWHHYGVPLSLRIDRHYSCQGEQKKNLFWVSGCWFFCALLIFARLLAYDEGREDEHSEYCRHRAAKTTHSTLYRTHSPKRKSKTRALGVIDMAHRQQWHTDTLTRTWRDYFRSLRQLSRFRVYLAEEVWGEVSAKIGQTSVPSSSDRQT